MNEKDTFSRYGKAFQEGLVQIMYEDRPFADQITEVLNTNFLELEYLRVFVDKIINYRDRYGTHPSAEAMITMLRTDLDNEDEWPTFSKLKKTWAKTRENAHSDYIIDHIETYGHQLDIVVEAKAKELAVKRYIGLHS